MRSYVDVKSREGALLTQRSTMELEKSAALRNTSLCRHATTGPLTEAEWQLMFADEALQD
jgi:hypothetical protein